MEKLAIEGLRVSFSRVQKIQDNITKQLCQQYLDKEIGCPRNIERGLLTVVVIDNVHYDPSSNAAKYSFHGSRIQCTKRMKGTYLISSLFMKTRQILIKNYLNFQKLLKYNAS